MPFKIAHTRNRQTRIGAESADQDEPVSTEKPQLVVLAVGEVSNWQKSGRSLPWESEIAFAEFREVSRELLETLTPDVVLSPLLCTSFDCLDLAQALHGFGYKGRYRVMVAGLPDPSIVLREARHLCPGLNIEFIEDNLISDGPAN